MRHIAFHNTNGFPAEINASNINNISTWNNNNNNLNNTVTNTYSNLFAPHS